LVFAYVAGKFALPVYSHRCSPKTFTQPQLFACLVLKEFLRLDYRKLAALLTDTPDLCKTIELSKVPHFTTFQKAAQRLLVATPARRLLDWTIHIGVALRRIKRRVVMAALDGTGFESHHASSYYVRRRETGGKHRGKYHSLTYRRFPKAGILCDCASHIILAVVPGHGPKPDILHYREALDEARRRVRLVTLAVDAGYDSEGSHEYARHECGIRSLIPALIGRRTNKPPSGYWRRQMKARLHTTRYSQRWQVETVNSMLKRLLDSALRARKRWNQYREIVLRSLTLNLMILRQRRVFYRAGRGSFRLFADRGLRDILPFLRVGEQRQMRDIRRGNQWRWLIVKIRRRLGGKNHVGVERLVVGRRNPAVAGVGPELGRFADRSR
jgi:hypothetical protein